MAFFCRRSPFDDPFGSFGQDYDYDDNDYDQWGNQYPNIWSSMLSNPEINRRGRFNGRNDYNRKSPFFNPNMTAPDLYYYNNNNNENDDNMSISDDSENENENETDYNSESTLNNINFNPTSKKNNKAKQANKYSKSKNQNRSFNLKENKSQNSINKSAVSDPVIASNQIDNTQELKDKENEKDTFSPNIDFIEETDNYNIYVDLPGIDKKNINIDLTDDVMTISGERKANNEMNKANIKNNTNNSIFSSINRPYYGQFKRSFPIPKDTDIDNIHAKLVNGVLEIIIKKIKN